MIDAKRKHNLIDTSRQPGHDRVPTRVDSNQDALQEKRLPVNQIDATHQTVGYGIQDLRQFRDSRRPARK